MQFMFFGVSPSIFVILNVLIPTQEMSMWLVIGTQDALTENRQV